MVGFTGQFLPTFRASRVARFDEDFGETVGEPVEATARSTVWQRQTKHFEHMLSSEQRIEHSTEVCSKSGTRHLGLWNKMTRF